MPFRLTCLVPPHLNEMGSEGRPAGFLCGQSSTFTPGRKVSGLSGRPLRERMILIGRARSGAVSLHDVSGALGA